MSKVLLIIYMLGSGDPLVYNSQFTFQQFQTIAQCEAAVVEMDKVVKKWHYGDDKEKLIPSKYTTKCWKVPGYVENYKSDPTRYLKVQMRTPKSKLEPQLLERTNKRWNDL